MRLHAALGLAALALATTGAAPAARFVDYLYIEANEGGSSGGHAAIRFGTETYHFQHEHPGLIRLRRDDSDSFRYAYGVLANRAIHVSRIVVEDGSYSELRRRFAERYLVERRLFDERQALADDRVLLEQLLARRRGDPTRAVDLRGAGFFFPDDPRAAPSAAGLALLERVERTYGVDTVARRIDEVRAALARLTPVPEDPEIPAEGYPHFASPFSSRYRDLLTALAALEALGRALPLRPDAHWPGASPVLRLGADEQHALSLLADRLTDELTRLLQSGRTDWGYAFLVGLARLAVIRESVETGRLVLLDAFPPGSEVAPWSSLREHRDVVPYLRGEAGEDLARARLRLRAAMPIREADYAAVEDAGNRLLELEAAVREERDLRVSSEPLVPSRPAPWRDLVQPEVADDILAGALVRADRTERRFAAPLERRYAYDLFSCNCVSEIFATMGPAAAALGARLDDQWSLDFIPFVSAHTVDARWNVAQRMALPSYRRAKLDEMYRRERTWRTWLRESNTLTSTIYRRNSEDSFFLFFTDDVVGSRPLLGAVNVAAGLGAGVAGVALLPFDHGHLLSAGLRGAVFSLPELAFVNLRKGSFTYVPLRERPVEPAR